LVKEAFANLKVGRLLPYNFVTAARYAPKYEPELEAAMMRSMEGVGEVTWQDDAAYRCFW
jgi:hypothetical protein